MKERFVYDTRSQKLEVGLVKRIYTLEKIASDFLEKKKNSFSNLPPPPSNLQNERGFLLLEHLISVVIVGILSIAFLSLMLVVQVYTFDQTSLTMHEVNTLAVRMQNEIRFADSLSASNGQLIAYFAEDEDLVSFTAQNDRLVRQVNGRGGEIMVYNLADMDVILFDNYSARIILRSFEGNVFQFYLETLRD